jgi:hypothetical protein
MLAEIFILRVETAAREATREEVASSRFVPIMLPAARLVDDTPLALVSAPRAREATPFT